MSDEWLDSICWSSLLLGIFMIKQCVTFSLALGTLKQDCDIKASEIMCFLPLKNNLVTVGVNFLLDSIAAIISSNTIGTPSISLLDWSPPNFHKHH